MSSHLTPGYPRIQRVRSFSELVTTPFANGINALCWPRTLPGDFSEVVALLGPGGKTTDDHGVLAIDPASLLTGHSSLTAAGRAAVATLCKDLRLLREHNLDPVLNLIHSYPRDEEGGPVPTDVFSFHADSAPIPADTWLCTYHGPPSEGLRNEDAVRKIDLPETRAALLKNFGGEEDGAFAEFLRENCYDLHYAAGADAQPFSFGLGHLWRIACEYPGSPVPPCIHRAPATRPGDAPRLLLIS